MRFLRQTLLSVCLILPCAIVMAQPTVANDVANGDEDTGIIINILNNDSPGGSAIDQTSVDLIPGGMIDATLTVPEGTFIVDAGGIVTFTPNAEFSGPVTVISYTVEDVDDQVSPAATITVTVNPVNDPPVITALGPRSVNEDATLGPITLTITDTDNSIGSLQLSGSSSNQTLVPNGNITFGTSGPDRTITVVPAANQSGGPVTITITVDDGPSDPDVTSTFALTINPVNDPPVITALGPRSVNEDATLGPITLTITDTDNSVGSLQLSGSSSNQTLVPNGNITFGTSGPDRTITVVPAANQSGGPVTITITVDDGPSDPDVTSTFALTINPVNDPPVITALGPRSVNEDATLGPITLTITDTDNSIGSLLLSGSSSNQTLVPNGNITFGTSGPNRTITVVPAANQSGGPVTITITVDDGPSDPDVTSTFALTINPVNDPPVITALGPRSVNEDATLGPITLTITDTDNSIGSLQLSGSSSNQTLVPNGNITFGTSGPDRTITVVPAANQSGGPVTITITVDDGPSDPDVTSTFALTINPINDPPVITAVGPRSVNEDATLGPITLTITDADNSIGSLLLSGSSSNQTLVPNGNITFGTSGPNRTITVVPAANQSGGPVTITITVDDGPSDPDVTSTFALTINPVNDPPVITALGPRSVNEDATLGPITLTITDPDNSIGSLQLSGSSSNQTLVPNGNITFGTSGPDRTITVVPAANQSGGPVTITITVDDGPSDPDVTSTFALTINGVNDPPVITAVGPRSVNEDATLGPITLTITDPDNTIGSLLLSGSSSNQTLVPNGNITFGTSGPDRTITVVPAANQSGGPVTITITVDDGPSDPDVTSTFALTVN